MSVQQKKNGTWFVHYRLPGGGTKDEYFGVGEKAKALAEERDRAIKEARAKKKAPPPPRNKIFLDELAQVYLDDRKLHGVSEGWLIEMERLLNNQFLPYLSGYPVDELEYLDVMRMAKACFSKVKLSTRQRYLGYLNAVFNYGRKHKITSGNPLDTWEKQPEPRYDYRLTLPDLENLVEHSSPHLAWAITVEWAVGARPGPSELYALQWPHVNYDMCRIRIPGTKTMTSDRIIPISETFRDDLAKREREARCTHICDYKGREVKTMRTAFSGAQKRAKLGYHVRMYDIRHLFVSVLLDGGAPVGAVSRLLGHSNVNTTQRWYYHLMPGEMERAIIVKPELRVKNPQPNGKI